MAIADEVPAREEFVVSSRCLEGGLPLVQLWFVQGGNIVSNDGWHGLCEPSLTIEIINNPNPQEADLR
jgi:hypothetical protein